MNEIWKGILTDDEVEKKEQHKVIDLQRKEN